MRYGLSGHGGSALSLIIRERRTFKISHGVPKNQVHGVKTAIIKSSVNQRRLRILATADLSHRGNARRAMALQARKLYCDAVVTSHQHSRPAVV